MPGLRKKIKKNEENVLDETEILRTQLARALADYDNLRKRTDEEKGIWFKVAASRVIEKFLGIYDMLVSAQSHLNDPGLAIVLGEFKKVIEEEGYEELNLSLGETEFDSQMMEVIETIGTDEENKVGKVAEVVMGGWKNKNNDEVLRHAKVKVYKLN